MDGDKAMMRRIRPGGAVQNSRARGVTLVEVLLVMVVLAVVGAFAWSGLQRPFAAQRLKSAADAVRTEWCQARVDAMRSGHTFAFRYVVKGDRYHLGPQEDPGASASSETDNATASQDELSALGEDPIAPPEDRTLPSGVKFLADDSADAELAAMEGEQETTESQADADAWSDPIFFYPDGTTSDARLVLASDRNSAIRVMLRGLTGTVTIGDLGAVAE